MLVVPTNVAPCEAATVAKAAAVAAVARAADRFVVVRVVRQAVVVLGVVRLGLGLGLFLGHFSHPHRALGDALASIQDRLEGTEVAVVAEPSVDALVLEEELQEGTRDVADDDAANLVLGVVPEGRVQVLADRLECSFDHLSRDGVHAINPVHLDYLVDCETLFRKVGEEVGRGCHVCGCGRGCRSSGGRRSGRGGDVCCRLPVKRGVVGTHLTRVLLSPVLRCAD